MGALDDVNEFIRVVQGNDVLAHIVGGADEQLIAEAETRLGIHFPPSYFLFLRNLGECDIAGEEFYGVWRRNNELYGAVRVTLRIREISSMPKPMLAFMSDGMGGYYVIDTSRLDEGGEASVAIWTPGESELVRSIEYVAPSFGEFALIRTRRALAA